MPSTYCGYHFASLVSLDQPYWTSIEYQIPMLQAATETEMVQIDILDQTNSVLLNVCRCAHHNAEVRLLGRLRTVSSPTA